MRKIKENDCGIARIESNGFNVWSQGNNQKIWYMVDGIGYSFARIEIETERKRREDFTGMRKYRIVTTNKFFVHLRIGKDFYAMKMHFENKSVKQQLIQFMENVDRLYRLAIDELYCELKGTEFDIEAYEIKFSNAKNTVKMTRLMQIKSRVE